MKKKCQIPKNSILRRIQWYFRLLSASSDDYFFATDMQNNVIMVSLNMVTDFGMPAEIFMDMNEQWLPRIHPDDYDAYVKELFKEYTPEDNRHDTFYRVRDARDNYVWIRCRGQVAFDNISGKPELFTGIIRILEQQNQADANTGLLTRCQFEQAVKQALQKNEDREIIPGAAIFFGLDNFKIINESYNRRFGNIMLKLAADAITRALPEGIMAYKLDGDEFAAVIPGMDAAGAQEMFEAVQRGFCRPYEVEGRMMFCTISAGTVLYPQGGKDYLVLCKHGEAALDQAKREGKNKNTLFAKDQYNRWLRSLGMRDDLQASIENGFEGFSLFYQPQVDARSQELIGAEALIRWRSPRGRMVSPMEFVRILEETKMIIPVGRWAFETGVKQCKAWQEKHPGMRISINLSYEQIKESGFQEFVLGCLKKYDVPPKLIVVELTETAIVSDWINVNNCFKKFREIGIQIAMDDFGTGYSSLAYMKNIVCDIVKIDRAFVTNILQPENEFDRRLVKSTIELCHSINIDCCIEGVETEEQYVLMRDLCNADIIQGYYFGRPECPAEFEKKFFAGEWIKENYEPRKKRND